MGFAFGRMMVLGVFVLSVVGLVNSGVISGVNNCSESEFPCDDGRQCVFKNKWCDSTVDCYDDSDEEYCHYSTKFNKDPNFCKGEKFICGNGPCIPFSGICDGLVSCGDGSDEKGCRNSSTETTLEILSTENLTTTAEYINLTTTAEYINLTTTAEYINSTSSSPKTKSLLTTLPADVALSQTSSSLGVTPLTSSSTSKPRTSTTSPTSLYIAPVVPLQDYKPLNSAVIRYPITKEQEIARMKAEAFLIKKYDSFSERDISRSVIALHLSNETFFSEDSMESRKISRDLQLKISTDLIRNGTNPICLSDLALHVNALLASCHNPHNFYGVDLARILRTRTDAAMKSGEFINPSVYLTLCFLEKGSFHDVAKLREIFITENEQLLRLDIQALALLAASCLSKVPEFSSLSKKLYVAPQFILNRLTNETYSDVYTTALLSQVPNVTISQQALTVAGVTAKDWKRAEALDFLLSSQNPDGSFGDVLSTYYVMPTLSGNDLESLKDGCYTNREKRESRWLEQSTEEQSTLVDISLSFGNSVDSVQSLQLTVKDNASFLEVLKKAEKTNPLFQLKYDELTTKPTIYAIGDTPNDAERGLFWNLYIAARKYPITKDYLVVLPPFMEDIRTLSVKNNSHIIFWFRNLFV